MRRKLPVDLTELDIAFEDASSAMNYYLDLETGEVLVVTDDVRQQLEELYEELGDAAPMEPGALDTVLQHSDLPPWLQAAVREADQVEAGFGVRYIQVPQADTHAAYQDMERFIATIGDQQFQDRLWWAIRGRGAFRRFKDALADAPGEQERWFAFRDARLRERVLE